MIQKLRQIPPVGWIALTALAGVTFLAWHAFDNDDLDTSWTDPGQPPDNVPFPADNPGAQCTPRCNTGFRSRSYPDTLVDADFSIAGEV